MVSVDVKHHIYSLPLPTKVLLGKNEHLYGQTPSHVPLKTYKSQKPTGFMHRDASQSTQMTSEKSFVSVLHCPLGEFGSPYLGKEQQPQEQRYPFLSVWVVLLCVQTMVWLPVFGIFNVPSAVDTRDCTQGPYGLCIGVCTGT